MRELTGNVAVITGAASGIGRAMADAFAAEGMSLMLADVEEAALATAERELEADGATVGTAVIDVADFDQVDRLAETTFARFGRANVVCNNAGVVARHLTWEGAEDWDWVLGVDLFGVINGVRAFVPRMLDSGLPGHVVNTASVAGLLAFPMIASYNVAKRGVVALSETMYMELQGTSLGVSVLCPGLVATRIGESERNRPGGPGASGSRLEAPDTIPPDVLVPADVAAAVVDAVKEERFWILTHPHFAEQAAEAARGRVADAKPDVPRMM